MYMGPKALYDMFGFIFPTWLKKVKSFTKVGDNTIKLELFQNPLIFFFTYNNPSSYVLKATTRKEAKNEKID